MLCLIIGIGHFFGASLLDLADVRVGFFSSFPKLPGMAGVPCRMFSIFQLDAIPEFFVKVIRHGVAHRLNQRQQAANPNTPGQQVGYRERDGKMADGKRNGLDHDENPVSAFRCEDQMIGILSFNMKFIII